MNPSLRFTCSLTVMLSTIFVSACSSDSANTQPADENAIAFEPCEGQTGMECGMFQAPLIHDSTDNRKITMEVARLPGTGDGAHQPLVLMLDAPASGIESLMELAQSGVIPAVIRERFDIIGFNQRGLVDPLRVGCDQLDNANTLLYPRDENDITTLVTDTSMAADACSAQYADQLQWLGSNAVVQDMEIMRSMLDAPTLNIIGSSFGTRIAALYLQRFPESSGRIILDAPLPPAGNIESLLLDTIVAQQRNFEQMLNACGAVVSDCDRETIEPAFAERMNSLLSNGDTETFDAFFRLLSLAVEESDIGELLAPLLIDYAIGGDPADVFALINELGIDDEDQGGDGALTLDRAVICADDAARPDVESLLAKLGDLNQSSNIFAEAILPIAATCAGWPEALQPVTEIRTTNAPVSLVIGGTEDANTPINWAVAMADATGGVFLTSEHQGHTTVLTRENPCVDSIVTEFLLEGTLPPEGTICN